MLRVLGRTPLRQKKLRVWAIAPLATAIATLVGYMGILQSLEWRIVDLFWQWQLPSAADARILVVTIDDDDIEQLGDWPISDQQLVDSLNQLLQYEPRMIGLDLYRNLPVEPGHQQLLRLFQTTSNLLVISKNFGRQQVAPPDEIPGDQVAFADLVEDEDGTVRRALLSARNENDQLQLSLATQLVLGYLAEEGIVLEALNSEGTMIQLGQAIFHPLRTNGGGYVRVDVDGYQILLGYTGSFEQFQSVSIMDVLADRVPEGMIRDRIVLIGSTAESTNDFFRTPYDSGSRGRFAGTAGVYIHASIVSQMLRAALDGRSLLQVTSEPMEILWTLGWTLLIAVVSNKVLTAEYFRSNLALGGAILCLVVGGVAVLGVSFVLFCQGWWLPVAVPLFGMTGAITANFILQNQQLRRLAFMDGLTQVANRRYFDQRFTHYSFRRGNLTLILCDVDCFKAYNDTYGHQAGDRCLQQVATAIRQSVRSQDLVARYGGEEFALILPNTDRNTATQIAQGLLEQIRQMNLPHKSSTVADHVTLSCGVVCITIDDTVLERVDWSPAILIAAADEALYRSKQTGRDRFTISG
jgi:diguanylate cyclase (GGDEF)-like protein